MIASTFFMASSPFGAFLGVRPLPAGGHNSLG
jgi:hypothetical protein